VDTRRVVVVGYDDAELLDIASVTGTLEGANRHHADPAYAIEIVSPGGKPIECAPQLSLSSHQALERCVGPLDTLIVSGGFGHHRAANDTHVVGHVRRLAHESRRVASVCTGASILAAAGLLDGRRVTTHWQFARDLAARYPAVTVDPRPIYLRDGKVATSAGVTSALDLTLDFVAEDHGAPLARRVARSLVTYLQRPGNQAQMSLHLAAPPPTEGLLPDLLDHITTHLDADLSAGALAARAGVSERHLARLFLSELGQTPGRYVRHVRVEAAAGLLATTTLPMPRVASRTGFASAETMRQAFRAQYGVSPAHYRATQTAAHAG
jgi:transcriptional regulator GlxA family with amidase domain